MRQFPCHVWQHLSLICKWHKHDADKWSKPILLCACLLFSLLLLWFCPGESMPSCGRHMKVICEGHCIFILESFKWNTLQTLVNILQTWFKKKWGWWCFMLTSSSRCFQKLMRMQNFQKKNSKKWVINEFRINRL